MTGLYLETITPHSLERSCSTSARAFASSFFSEFPVRSSAINTFVALEGDKEVDLRLATGVIFSASKASSKGGGIH